MQAKLLGVMDVNFTNNNGEIVSGRNIFCSFLDANVHGQRCEKFFLNNNKVLLPKETKINDTLNLIFDYKGRIENIEKV